MTKIYAAVFLFSLTLMPSHARASEPDFTYIELTAGQSEMESAEHDSLGLIGSLSLTDKYYLAAEFEQLEREGYRGADYYFLGAGYAHSLNEASKLYLQVDYTLRKMVSEYDESLSGYRLTLGYRNQLNASLEAYTKLSYLSLESDGNEYDDGESNSLITVGLKYNFISDFSAIVELNENGFKLGLRVEL